jgi:ATP-dependent protease ClpP protease subunit
MSKISFFNRPLRALATSVMLALSALAAVSGAAHAEPNPPKSQLRYAIAPNNNAILVMIWNGEVKKGMSDEIDAAFQQYKDQVKAVELKINSGGGSVAEGERVIKVLQDIKQTHKLYTYVGAGKKCGSMCVFIYVQGEKRLAAPASLWLFHEVSVVDNKTHEIRALNRSRWEDLVQKYWVPAGVNPDWIETVKAHTLQTDYWQAGQSLLQDGSNVVTNAVSDENRRVVVPAKVSDAGR